MKKRIEVVEIPVKDIGTGFGNPRKIGNKKRKQLVESLDMFGDFGCIVIDENNDVISGNQRLSVLREKDESQLVLCKKLIGYTTAEKKAINIKANTHAGDWDLDMLAEWTADLQLDLGIEEIQKDPNEMNIKDMELIHFEKYNYVMIVCKYETDFNDLVRRLGIEGKKVAIHKKRKIQARAIWYDEMEAQIIAKE